MSENTKVTDQQFIEMIVKQLVENESAVVVERSIDERGVLITLKVDRADMGKVIGKDGQTAKALRILLRVIGSKNNARINLKIAEPDGSNAEMSMSRGGNSSADLDADLGL